MLEIPEKLEEFQILIPNEYYWHFGHETYKNQFKNVKKGCRRIIKVRKQFKVFGDIKKEDIEKSVYDWMKNEGFELKEGHFTVREESDRTKWRIQYQEESKNGYYHFIVQII